MRAGVGSAAHPWRSCRAPVLLWLLACLAVASLLAFRELGTRPLLSPAEARYALVAREMVESGDWIQPHLNHVRYYEKPPLLYWAIAASYRLVGVSEIASRLPSALAYVGTVGVTFLIGLAIIDTGGAVIAALVYASSIGPFLFGRFVFTDTLFVFWLTVSLLGLVWIARRRGGLGPPILFYVGLSLAGLTKGLVGIVFPVASAATWWLFFGDRRLFREFRPVLGAAIVAGVFVPWHVLLAGRDPSFLYFYIVNEHILRFLNTREPIDYTPLSITGFWLATFLWFSPWSFYLPGALASAFRDRRGRLALPFIWAAWVLGFFTLMASRLEYYGLPALPALAVALAHYWQRLAAGERQRGWLWLPGAILFAIALALPPAMFLTADRGSAALTSLISNLDGYYREYFIGHPGESFALVEGAIRLAAPFMLLLLVVAGGVSLAVYRSRLRLAFAVWIVGLVPLLTIVDLGMQLVSPDRSQHEFARVVRAEWAPGADLVVFGNYEDYCGISYYTGYPTRMVEGFGGDLLFGYRKGDAPGLFLSRAEFEREWASPRRVFVVGDKSLTLPGAWALAESPREVLLSNQPPARKSAREGL